MKNEARGTLLETERLRLRWMAPEDEDNILQIVSDPVAMQHYPQVYDRNDVQQLWMAKNVMRYERDGHGFFMCEIKPVGAHGHAPAGEFVGMCGQLIQEIDGVNEFEVGYLFVREHWGHGYATEAARALRDHGFRTYPVPHIISIIAPANTPSIAVARRNGMTLWKEAMFKDILHHIYRITRDEWKSVNLSS